MEKTVSCFVMRARMKHHKRIRKESEKGVCGCAYAFAASKTEYKTKSDCG